MKPTQLRTFLAVCKHRSFTRAAEELFLSQPTASRQVRQLERELGIALFEQIGKSLHLTGAGETLAREARGLLGAMERAAEKVRAHRSAAHGSLRIGASTTPGFYLLPSLLGRFHQRYPEVDLHFAVENSRLIGQRLVHNELDLGFAGAHLESPNLVEEVVALDEIICFAAPSHRLASRKRVAPRLLEKETCVLRERGSATRRLFQSWLDGRDGKLGKTIELGCPEAIKALVAAGLGFSFMSVHGLRDELRRGRLARLPVAGLRLRRPIYLLRHTDKHTTPVMDAFLDLVRARLPRVP